jgi:hypothetical protein
LSQAGVKSKEATVVRRSTALELKAFDINVLKVTKPGDLDIVVRCKYLQYVIPGQKRLVGGIALANTNIVQPSD